MEEMRADKSVPRMRTVRQAQRTFGQCFNATLGCFVHVLVLVPDGVFTRAANGAVVFRQGPAPTRADLVAVAAPIEKRMRRWMRRCGLVDERVAEDRSNEAPEFSRLEACICPSRTAPFSTSPEAACRATR